MRTEKEIQEEFMRLCAQLGEMHYRKAALESQIAHTMNGIGQLEQDYRGLKATQESAAATTTEPAAEQDKE